MGAKIYFNLGTRVIAMAFILAGGSLMGADPEMERLKAELMAQIEAQTSALKATYETRIQQMDERIKALESDNARLKQAAADQSEPTVEIASMKARIT